MVCSVAWPCTCTSCGRLTHCISQLACCRRREEIGRELGRLLEGCLIIQDEQLIGDVVVRLVEAHFVVQVDQLAGDAVG